MNYLRNYIIVYLSDSDSEPYPHIQISNGLELKSYPDYDFLKRRFKEFGKESEGALQKYISSRLVFYGKARQSGGQIVSRSGYKSLDGFLPTAEISV